MTDDRRCELVKLNYVSVNQKSQPNAISAYLSVFQPLRRRLRRGQPAGSSRGARGVGASGANGEL